MVILEMLARLVKIHHHEFQAKGSHFQPRNSWDLLCRSRGISNNYADQVVFHGEKDMDLQQNRLTISVINSQEKRLYMLAGDNANNGADRIVDDVYIQTKYCKTGSKCISECFDNNTFKYMQGDTPMQMETFLLIK